MRTEQTKKEMQADESVEMTVEQWSVIYQLMKRGIRDLEQNSSYFRNDLHSIEMSTGHSKTVFPINRDEIYDIIINFEGKFMNAVCNNVEGVVY